MELWTVSLGLFFALAVDSMPQEIMPYIPNLSPKDRCNGVVIRGPCTDWSPKWYFNQTIQACRTFIYGGCKGENVFNSEAECLHYCIGGQHTLPPNLRPRNVTTDKPEILRVPKTTTIPPAPYDERGAKLTFAETGYQEVFMMAKSNAFIQLDGNRITEFQLRMSREISFQFRTRLPHGLLVYHSIKDRPPGLNPYALYVIVEKGQLKVVHVFGKHSTSMIVGEGLNRDRWHSVTVTIDLEQGRLKATVDDQSGEDKIQGFHKSKNYGVTKDLTSVVLIGGLSPEEKLHGVKYIIESFVGCIKDVRLSAGKNVSSLTAIIPLIATKHDNVLEGCIDKCRTRENLCFVGSKCINHYNHLSCDCFGTYYEGEQCDIYTATILTLRGFSFVSYRVYDWKDRVHSSVNRISLHFKTRFDDSALFYASGENIYPPYRHYIGISLLNSTIIVDIDLGYGAVVKRMGSHLTDNKWHNLTLLHVNSTVTIYLDDTVAEMKLPGSNRHLYIDPEINIGGGTELNKNKGLYSVNNFIGSLKYVFYNDASILYELNKTSHKVHYIGVLEPLFAEVDVDVIPMTFPFSSSNFAWKVASREFLHLQFEYKSNKNAAVIAASAVMSEKKPGWWELKIVNDELRFELVPDSMKNVTYLLSVKVETKNVWHSVEVLYLKGEVALTVGKKPRQKMKITEQILLGDKIVIGSAYPGGKASVGFVGCLREVFINREFVEPRLVVLSKRTTGEVSLDNCELVDPCKRPNACEHNGKCSVKDDRLTCDCKDTGYIGKNCHFAKFRKTCEELALLGYTKPDVYLIDIDGNGRFPPAHVKCEFQSFEDSTKTIVEHNLPSQVDVRSASESDFSFQIMYREFTSEMLQELISHSLYCSQYIKYDCYKAPLELHSATWFVAAANNGTVDYLGNVKRGSCTCAENRTCVSTEQSCNCDISEAKWLSDDGYYISPNSLGITQMVFLQQTDLEEDALGRITLGPLECVETNTQKYVVTFTTSQSYIEVPGWRKGDIAFSFRTTGEKAILLYQPPIRPHHPSFMVALTSDFQLTFNFTLNTGNSRELAVKSQRKLNSGEWQKIWIDYNEHHVRFMINTDYQMVDLLPDEEFGPFEGSMFIGGATEELLVERSVKQGLIGCFRGLVVNGEILDIYSYMSVHLSEIIQDCKPSCYPNPCKNGAKCKELWSTFQCVCENSWAYIGTFCETNINENGITQVLREPHVSKNFLSMANETDKSTFKNLLQETILLNIRTYDNHSLILHANDHLNNFIQLYIKNESRVVFCFNSGDLIHNVSVDYHGLNSGKSVQIAIVRNYNETILHVNDKNSTVIAPILLLTNYSSKPWANPEQEVLAPQRPPAPPTEYFQVNIGGYENLLNAGQDKPLEGFIGCIRGLKIGDTVVNLTNYIEEKTDNASVSMIPGCRMKCDENPCKNQGICIEDFLKGEASCNCEFTSYEGESCSEEKGADFGGESVLQRKFTLEANSTINNIKVQLAFSSSDNRQRSTALLLLQTVNKSYYLIVALNIEGDLIIEEDREGSAYGVKMKDRSFLNGARHSVYYKRINDSAILLVDREEVQLVPIPVLSLTEVPGNHGANEVQVGGLNTSDPRFAAYMSYSGCLSNVILEVNGQEMKPLEEYMSWKTGSTVHVQKSQGVRSAQCAFFEAMNKPRPGPVLNLSSVSGEEEHTWVEDPPAKIPYKSLYSGPSTAEEGTGRVLFIIATSMFCIFVTGTFYHVYRTHVAYKRRKEAETTILWHNAPIQYKEPPIPIAPIKSVRSRSVCEGSLYTGQNGRPVQYQESLLRPAIKLTRSKSQDDSIKSSSHNGSDLKPVYKSSPSTPAPVVRFRIPSDDHIIRENGIQEKNIDEEERRELLKPSLTNEIKEDFKPNEVIVKPNLDVVTYTIDEDHAGEMEEEEEMQRNLRPRSVDFSVGGKDKLEEVDRNRNSIASSSTSLSSTGGRQLWGKLLGPVYLNERLRSFGTPLSYFRVQRFRRPSANRSKESVMSLD
ncbi:contactin-associated protein like 5-1 isoform X3 [Cimex lectularius]|uniref:Uncharacterized protein n=1 Tax=Cimex lectularius TaxID=79782 RepID=A0A8I6RG27_CIMLE|nr:contactin-associated protein like 5-1 isoform X3 [Cimex lectularius]